MSKRFILASTFLVLLINPFVFSQTNQPLNSKKLVFVNEYDFEDNKTGITKLVKALEIAYRIECYSKCGKIVQLQQKLANKDISEIKLNKKETELLKLVKDRNNNVKKRVQMLVSPIKKELKFSLENFATVNNLKVLSIEKHLGNIIYFDDELDITYDFVSHFNKQRNKTINIKRNIANTKIAIIDGNLLFDKIIGLRKKDKKLFGIIKSQVSNEIRHYAKSKGFNIVFDQRKEIQQTISGFTKRNLTLEFILYFNKKYRDIEEK